MSTNAFTLEDLTEDQAIEILDAFRQRFGWPIVGWTTRDISRALGRTATDEEIERVQSSGYWNRLEEHMTETGWDFVHWAIEEAGAPYADTEQE